MRKRFEPVLHRGMSINDYFQSLADQFIEWANDDQLPPNAPQHRFAHCVRTHDDEGREIEADGFVTIRPQVR